MWQIRNSTHSKVAQQMQTSSLSSFTSPKHVLNVYTCSCQACVFGFGRHLKSAVGIYDEWLTSMSHKSHRKRALELTSVFTPKNGLKPFSRKKYRKTLITKWRLWYKTRFLYVHQCTFRFSLAFPDRDSEILVANLSCISKIEFIWSLARYVWGVGSRRPLGVLRL